MKLFKFSVAFDSHTGVDLFRVQYHREVDPIESPHCLDRGTGKKDWKFSLNLFPVEIHHHFRLIFNMHHLLLSCCIFCLLLYTQKCLVNTKRTFMNLLKTFLFLIHKNESVNKIVATVSISFHRQICPQDWSPKPENTRPN